MIIPYNELSPEALRGVIEEFITREGTDYGEVEYSLEEKVAQIQALLESKQVFIVFDSITERCTIITKDELQRLSYGND